MRVAELMQKNLTTIQVDDRVSDAVSRIAEAHVSGLPVLDDRGAFVGVLSATDILVAESESEQPDRVVATGMVRDLMTPRPLTIGADEAVRTAARQMLYAEVHRLFVEGRRARRCRLADRHRAGVRNRPALAASAPPRTPAARARSPRRRPGR